MIDYKSVKARHNLVQVVESTGIALRREGRRLVACCPFHQGDRTPSFTVYPETQTFFCFGCDAWGDVVDFVKRIRGLSNEEAVAYLEGQPSKVMATPRIALAQPRPATCLTDETRAVLEKAVRLYELNLRENQREMGYLRRRGLTIETIFAERLGYSGTPGALAKTLGIRERRLAQEIGLLNEKGRERMWQRLTFPIFREGRPVWLIGRSLEDDTWVRYLGLTIPKPLMGQDSLATSSTAWVVEGVFDLLLLRQLARELRRTIPAVALLGTHPSAEVLQALKQKSRVFLCLDGDAPGREAARALRRELGKRAVLVPLPDRSKDIGELLADEVKDLVLSAYLPFPTHRKSAKGVAPLSGIPQPPRLRDDGETTPQSDPAQSGPRGIGPGGGAYGPSHKLSRFAPRSEKNMEVV